MTVTQTDAINWLNAQVGQHLDYDHEFGQQCVDYFNYYYQFVTGENPYALGYGVPGAKDLWGVPDGRFTKLPDSPTLKPIPGDIAVYGAAWGNGYGHVEVVVSTDERGCTFVGENEHNDATQGVVRVYRTWAQMRGLLGVMRPLWYVPPSPSVPEPVVVPVVVSSPYVPPAAPVIAEPAKKYDVLTTLMYFSSSQDATFHKDAKGVLESGEYFEFDTKDTTVQLGDNNMKPLYWINTKDNVVSVPQPAPKPDPVAVAALDVATLFTPFPDGKSRRYIAQRDMYIYDLAAKDATGINIKQDAPVPIFGYLTNNGLTYLIPRLNADSVEGRVAPKKHYYGIPTTSVYTGLPGMMSQQYIDALKRAENENRIYRKSVGHETTDDRLYYAQQLIARSVSDGVRFLSEVIPLKRLKAMYSQKDKTKK